MKASMANFPSHVEEIGAVAAHFDVLDQIRRFVRRCLLLRLGHGQLQNVLSKDGAVGDGEEEDGRRLESRCVVVVRAEDVDGDEALGRQRRFPIVENLAIGLFAVRVPIPTTCGRARLSCACFSSASNGCCSSDGPCRTYSGR